MPFWCLIARYYALLRAIVELANGTAKSDDVVIDFLRPQFALIESLRAHVRPELILRQTPPFRVCGHEGAPCFRQHIGLDRIALPATPNEASAINAINWSPF